MDPTKPCPTLGYTPALVLLSSEQGMTPCPSCALYSASKHGIIGLTQSIAAAYPTILRVNTVLPGLVDTPLTWNQVKKAPLRWWYVYSCTVQDG